MANYQQLHDEIYQDYQQKWNYQGHTGHDIGLVAAEFMTDIEVYLQKINDVKDGICDPGSIGLNQTDINQLGEDSIDAKELVTRVKSKILAGDGSVIRPIVRIDTYYAINQDSKAIGEIPAQHKLKQLMDAFPELIGN